MAREVAVLVGLDGDRVTSVRDGDERGAYDAAIAAVWGLPIGSAVLLTGKEITGERYGRLRVFRYRDGSFGNGWEPER